MDREDEHEMKQFDLKKTQKSYFKGIKWEISNFG